MNGNNILDKREILTQLKDDSSSPIILELGCGNYKRIPNSIGIDALDYESVDIVGDVFSVLKKIPRNSVASVHSFHFFEHVSDQSQLLDEISRVLVSDGLLEIVVPHFSNPYFYSDYTHKVFYGLYSFSYLSVDNLFKRKTPTYQKELVFELMDAKLCFKSSKSFVIRHSFKKFFLEPLFNSSVWIKEFYEENLCYLFPCYELKFSLKQKQKN